MSDSADNSNSVAPIRFAELEARKLSTRLADSITETILKNALKPGARLPSEREMREQFGVGRGTLREALRVLEAEGLITVRSGPHGGPVVAKPDPNRLARLLILLLLSESATLRNVYDVRIVLEPLAAAEAAKKATQEQIGELAESVTALRDVIEDERSLIVENQRFHRLIAEASGNPVLVAFSLSLLTIFDGYAMGLHYEDVRGEIVKAHEAISKAIASGNAEKAYKAASTHVNASIHYLTQRYPQALDEPLRPTLLPQP